MPGSAGRGARRLRGERPVAPRVLGEPQLVALPGRHGARHGRGRRAAGGRLRHVRVQLLLELQAVPGRHRAGPRGRRARAPRIDKIRRFFNHPGFIEPFADHARAALASLPGDVREDAHLVFTAHSIPVAMAEASGPSGGRRYVAELTEAARLIAERLGGTHPWTLAYQSRSGPPSQPWLEPDVRDHLAELAKSGTLAVVVIPVGFVTDHMEVRHDLDLEAAHAADALGLAFARAATPGTHPRFASMITELVRERLAPGDGPGGSPPWARWAGRAIRAPRTAAAGPGDRSRGAAADRDGRGGRGRAAARLLAGPRASRGRRHQVEPDRRGDGDGPPVRGADYRTDPRGAPRRHGPR